MPKPLSFLILILLTPCLISGCAGENEANQSDPDQNVRLLPVGTGWAQSSVNAVIFRINSIDTFEQTQVVSWYDEEGTVMLARRELDSENWVIHATPYSGDVTNAHNAISIGFDGNGILHMVWGLHNAPLQYVRSESAGRDQFSFTDPMPMTGQYEESVTYPQFFRLDNGDLLFMYRDGGSGRGDIMLNRYSLDTGEWQPVQHPVIDGGGELSPYVNPLVIDNSGGWHLSWNWRETPDVASNHDLAYAWSPDEGETWLTSTGDEYDMPIHSGNAETIKRIPQNSELINQTSIAVDGNGNPVIATYWRPEGTDVPQYHVVRFDEESGEWVTHQVGDRTLEFSLSGYGTRRIPIARPLVLTGEEDEIIMIFRDFERGGGISVAISHPPGYLEWQVSELDTTSVGLWEPTHDPATWKRDGVLHLFHQFVGQGEAETLEDVEPQEVSILEWRRD